MLVQPAAFLQFSTRVVAVPSPLPSAFCRQMPNASSRPSPPVAGLGCPTGMPYEESRVPTEVPGGREVWEPEGAFSFS